MSNNIPIHKILTQLLVLKPKKTGCIYHTYCIKLRKQLNNNQCIIVSEYRYKNTKSNYYTIFQLIIATIRSLDINLSTALTLCGPPTHVAPHLKDRMKVQRPTECITINMTSRTQLRL